MYSNLVAVVFLELRIFCQRVLLINYVCVWCVCGVCCAGECVWGTGVGDWCGLSGVDSVISTHYVHDCGMIIYTIRAHSMLLPQLKLTV